MVESVKHHLKQVQVIMVVFPYMGVSENSGTPKLSILIGFSIINHPFWGTPIFGNTHIMFFSFFYLCFPSNICLLLFTQVIFRTNSRETKTPLLQTWIFK